MTDNPVYSVSQGGVIRSFQLGNFTEIQRLVGHTRIKLDFTIKFSGYLCFCSDNGNVKKRELGDQPKDTKIHDHMGKV